MSQGFLDKDRLKRELHLAYVLAHYDVALDEQGRALCPFHDDTNPSLTLYADDEGLTHRFHCFACGTGGDLYDFILKIDPDVAGFWDAVFKAEDIHARQPRDWTPPIEPKAHAKADATTWVAALKIAQDNMKTPQVDGMVAIMTRLIPSPDEPPDKESLRVDAFIRDQWRWGITDHLAGAAILLPHYDRDGNLTGIKKRSIGRAKAHKWAQPGSSFPALYGAWRPRKYRDLLLCEGESDAVWASLQDAPVDVLALPSGANKISDDWVKHARDWDTIYLAFDADAAGMRATRAWLDVLPADRVRVCRLPWEHDLRAARPDLKTLLQTSIQPTPIPGTIQRDTAQDRFIKITGQGQSRPLCSWMCEPVARLVPGDPDDEELEPAIVVHLQHQGRVFERTISAHNVRSVQNMRKWAARNNVDWDGSDSDSTALWTLLSAESQILPEIYQTNRVGVHQPPEEYRYAGNTLVLPDESIGKLPWRSVSDVTHGRVALPPAGEWTWRWLEDALALATLDLTTPLLAWFTAACRRVEVRDFPIMFVGGSSGSGKSTIVSLLCKMFGSELQINLGSTTRFPLIVTIASTTTIPVFVDEWTLQSKEDARQALRGAVPEIYAGITSQRGHADVDRPLRNFRMTAPVVVAGEDEFNLTRERDRIMTIHMTRRAQNPAALASLAPAPHPALGRALNDFILNADDGVLPEMPSPANFATRPEYNDAILHAGWDTLKAFTDADAEFAPVMPALDLTGVNVKNEDVMNEFEEFIMALRDLRDANSPYAWSDEHGTWYRPTLCFSENVMRRLGAKPPGGQHSTKSYFEGKGYKVTRKKIKPPDHIGTVSANCIVGWYPKDG